MTGTPSQDIWHASAAQVEVDAYDDGLSQVGSPSFGGKSSKMLVLALALLILALGGFIAFSMLETDGEESESVDYMARLTGAIDHFFADEAQDEFAEELSEAPVSKKTSKKGKEVAESPAPNDIKPEEKLPEVQGNPYWALPNRLTQKLEITARWTPEEETAIRAGLTHTFRYQRFKTIQDLRKHPLLGSEAALWDAQADSGFWVRAFALLAIVEQGTDVPLSALDQAIGKAHPDLVANFFRRFIKKPTPASTYLARHAIKLLDANGRLVALEIIARSRDTHDKEYLSAALQDPDLKVQKFAKKSLRRR